MKPDERAITMAIQFEFDTREYEFTHGRAPRGYGGWAFDFRTSDGGKTENAEPIFAPASNYVAAKAWIKNHIKSIAPAGYDGVVKIVVCT